MMRSSVAFGILLSVIAFLLYSMDFGDQKIVARYNNLTKEPLEIELEKYICFESKLPIIELENSAQAITAEGKTYFFNDVGNVMLWLSRQSDKESIVVWVYAKDTKRYVNARNAWYSRIELTPMGYGFGAYELRLYGTADYYFDEIYLCAIRGETLLNPMINKLLSENKIPI